MSFGSSHARPIYSTTNMQKLYIVTKYVVARSVAEAMRLEKKLPADDVFIDTDWRQKNITTPDSGKKVGFKKKR